MAKKDKNEKMQVHELVKFTVEPLQWPIHSFPSLFKTLNEWLLHLCHNQAPDKPVSEYSFQTLYSQNQSIVAFVGYYVINENGVITRFINFRPTNMFFQLPKKEYGRLTLCQFNERIKGELEQFVITPQFQNSYLAKDLPINASFGRIWPKERGE